MGDRLVEFRDLLAVVLAVDPFRVDLEVHLHAVAELFGEERGPGAAHDPQCRVGVAHVVRAAADLVGDFRRESPCILNVGLSRRKRKNALAVEAALPARHSSPRCTLARRLRSGFPPGYGTSPSTAPR